MENQVRFNMRRSENNPTCLEWFFLVLNKDKREIPRIKTGVYNLFRPIIEEYKSYEGVLENKWRYDLIHFDSEAGIDSGWKSKIFQKMLKDNELYSRVKDQDGLEKYISELDKKL